MREIGRDGMDIRRDVACRVCTFAACHVRTDLVCHAYTEYAIIEKNNGNMGKDKQYRYLKIRRLLLIKRFIRLDEKEYTFLVKGIFLFLCGFFIFVCGFRIELGRGMRIFVETRHAGETRHATSVQNKMACGVIYTKY